MSGAGERLPIVYCFAFSMLGIVSTRVPVQSLTLPISEGHRSVFYVPVLCGRLPGTHFAKRAEKTQKLTSAVGEICTPNLWSIGQGLTAEPFPLIQHDMTSIACTA